MFAFRSRHLAKIAFGLTVACAAALSGCDSRVGDGETVEEPTIDADQKAEVKAQYLRQKAERRKAAKARARAGNTRRPNG